MGYQSGLTETQTLLRPDEAALQNWLQSQLSEERYYHSLGAQQKAIELATHFQLTESEIEKASLAGLLHDCAKLRTPGELFQAVSQYGIILSEDDRRSPQTLHPFVGAEWVRERFGIVDDDVLNAIRYHTTGRPKMSPVEKIVFLADKMEGNTRNPLYTQKIMALINFQDRTTLDRAVLYVQDSTINYLIEKGQYIHLRTIEARNDLVAAIKACQSNR